jgi:hypothetical protein
VVRNVSALHNGWAGLLAADGMRILGGHYNDNDQLGIGGNAATGILMDGLDGDPTTFDGPELARNHTLHAACDWEAGGMKWYVGQIAIRNAHVHDNDCRGLWADINAHDALIEQDRLDSTPPAHLLDGLDVHDNLICATADGEHPPASWPTMAPTSQAETSASPATPSRRPPVGREPATAVDLDERSRRP